VFELTDLATHDEVVFDGAGDVQLGGTLKIETDPAFSAFGEYKLFDLDTGTPSGSFSEVIKPILDAATVDEATVYTDGNDVMLRITKVPQGTMILVR
jgi:hypothetical protein